MNVNLSPHLLPGRTLVLLFDIYGPQFSPFCKEVCWEGSVKSQRMRHRVWGAPL